MSRIQILDCTLRDGGYCNNWEFGNKNINKIISGLNNAGIDIVECGFLTNKTKHTDEITKYNTIEQIAARIPEEKMDTKYVAMVNFGEYELDDFPTSKRKSAIGIRVAFHKKDVNSALELCKGLNEWGYTVFVQPMVSLNYSDQEFLQLIERVNEFNPYAFYIVDSFGMMKQKDLIRLFYMVEHSLDESICIGYHSHNNMQLAYSNAQTLVGIQTKRNIIIDSSVFGMGRGAGNLNTELFVEYLNDCMDTSYRLEPLLQMMDEVINRFYMERPWGYSLPNYLSAAHNCHPNYAIYLSGKHTLTVEGMNEIFSMMDAEKKIDYDKQYIEKMYIHYMEHGSLIDIHMEELKNIFHNKKVLLIASGKSVDEEKNKILQFMEQHDAITVGVNFKYAYMDTDYIFVSNVRRYRELENIEKNNFIITSNIKDGIGWQKVEYESLLNVAEGVEDNSALMLVKLLIMLGVEAIYVAGVDGYSSEIKLNYTSKNMNFKMSDEQCCIKNEGLSAMLREYAKQVPIEFLTKEHFVKL